jgi:predicted RNA-binding Zn-ribbon protein involved in translation (DUF1610 family)
MPYDSIRSFNENLAENPNLTDHNKEVLNAFFRKRKAAGTGPSTLGDYASRFNALAPYIDFKLDEAKVEDLEKIAGKINADEIEMLNGSGNYGDHSKDAMFKTLNCFYNQFIKQAGKGYNEEIDGENLMEDIEPEVTIEDDIDTDKIPNPEQVKKVADAANSLRDRCIVFYCWSLGNRIGEVAKTPETQQYPEPMKWKDIRFKEKEMEVTLRGKTGVRTIYPRTAMPLMKQLYNKEDPDLSDPVFTQQNPRNFCPNCNDVEVKTKEGDRNLNYEYRTFECKNCGWEGKHHEAEKRKKPMDDDDMRQVLRRLVKRADVDERVTDRPHNFFRKGRALYWSARGRSEDFLRGWFGWSEKTRTASKYKKLMRETTKKGVKEDFGESLNEEEREFGQEFVKPSECECGEWVSPMWDYCKNCENELEDSLRAHNKPDRVLQEAVDTVARQSGANKIDGFDPEKDAKAVAEFNEARHQAKNTILKQFAKRLGKTESEVHQEMTEAMKEELKGVV